MSGENGIQDAPCTLREGLERARMKLVREAVDRCGGDRREAARQLGVSYTTLWRFSEGNNRSGAADRLCSGVRR